VDGVRTGEHWLPNQLRWKFAETVQGLDHLLRVPRYLVEGLVPVQVLAAREKPDLSSLVLGHVHKLPDCMKNLLRGCLTMLRSQDWRPSLDAVLSLQDVRIVNAHMRRVKPGRIPKP
jgi:hypothetical protein